MPVKSHGLVVTRHFTSNGSIGVIAFHEKAGQAYALAR
jgi:hypothetical protein